ncbi:MAG: polyprenyl synthetase family protein [Candidatus Methanoperedens sp.]|nr:polyprenyl synthetase family protein [Candidatus Methanoperedens sp.]
MVNESIPNFPSITPLDEMYLAMHRLMDADGKRLRPSTLLVAAEAVGGEPEDVIPAALAIELINNVCLIHNDIINGADTRKGYLTVHKIWGASDGILAGDALYSKAFEILSYAKSGPSQIIESMQILSKTYIDLCEGQWMDIDFQKRNDVTESEYLQMVEKKTAVLFAAGLKIGAVLSNASREEAQALWDFGCLAGVGFQIYDDVTDLIASEGIPGEPESGDIIEGKRTIKILKETGSIDRALNRASSFIDAGKSALEILPDSEAKKILIGFTDYMVQQKYYG